MHQRRHQTVGIEREVRRSQMLTPRKFDRMIGPSQSFLGQAQSDLLTARRNMRVMQLEHLRLLESRCVSLQGFLAFQKMADVGERRGSAANGGAETCQAGSSMVREWLALMRMNSIRQTRSLRFDQAW